MTTAPAAVPLREADAEARIGGACFTTGPPGRVGVELEWLVHDRIEPRRVVPVRRVDAALAALEQPGSTALPGGSRLTREPGGQVELSTPPAASLIEAVRATATDLTALRSALAGEGLTTGGLGLEPFRDPPRVLHDPRYGAMESYFDRVGPWGRLMMRATASVQINLDAGDESTGPAGYRYRWRLAHRLGPVLLAAFANSPLWRGRRTGWVSTRQAVWARMDPTRTRPPDNHSTDADPRAVWTRYALDAQLMCVRRTPPAGWDAPGGVTFRSWLRGALGEHRPRADDLDYHLSTLFPPIRPRGWLELRMVDAQSGDRWVVPLVLAAVLMDDPVAAEAAYAATEPLTGGRPHPPAAVWLRAAQRGPADPELGRAARACFAAADRALARDPHAAGLRRVLADFADRYPRRGRCPADDHPDPDRTAAAPARRVHRHHTTHQADRPADPPIEGRFRP
ncbi:MULTISPECIES: ergothioneine biosynthesis glutamate--cysteine ligase EgtA [unclassified Streptomyces]|uniref:ergothioneine biosynthesis glutamate--cysteine ligase EgtA n=1 Tax=unclassified Streptomyces TaxID=2593676 RepID=UPI0019034231|nr:MULTISPECIES: ergothioneine biosynthesis glutamate--cysteine ligase EgtA [unclassified Streptomyces]MCU4749187.1 ergothioneine biosynthesis glutamate--cysteine ligase EgtA [Streptomyces sp. G-5]QQN77270.1 ergothioneine biosynthesis glutamate--cysteine ligase EgtA [Streptomyces sp. XC 2026]